jgi:PAS domain S-box-containing protein
MWQSVAAFLPDTIFVLNLQTQEVSDINHPVFLGHRTEELFQPADFVSCLHPDDRKNFAENREHALTLPDGATTELEHRLLDRRGEWAWVRSRSGIVQRLPDGTPSRLMVVLTDITQQKINSFVQERTREQLDSVLRLAADAIIVVDSDERIVLFNHAAENIFGYDAAEILFEPLDRLVPEPSSEKHHRGVTKFMNSAEKSMLARVHARRKDGTIFPTETGVSKYVQNGRMYFTVVVRDMTELEKLAAELERTVAVRTRELVRTTQRVTAILNNDADSIVLADEKGLIQQTNTAFNKLFLCEPDAYFDHSMTELVMFEDVPAFQGALNELLSAEAPQRVEVTARRSDGTQVMVEISMSVVALFNDDDEPERGIVCAMRDITRRKAMEQALFESRLFSQTILNSLSSYVAVLARDGTVTAVNTSWLALSDEHRDAWPFQLRMGANFWSFSQALEKKGFPDARVMMDGVKQVITGAAAEFTYEYSLLLGDERRWHMMYVTPLLHASGGVVIMHEDISPLKVIEEALRDSEKFIQSVAASTPDAIYVYDLVEHRNIYINRELPEILGYSKEDVLAPNWRTRGLLHPDDTPMIEADMTPEYFARLETAFAEHEFRVRHKDGTWRWLYARDTIFSYDENGMPRTVLGVAQDITVRKFNEEALETALNRERELNELKSRFVSMVSHEYRTPLAVIRTNADLLMRYRHKLDDAGIELRLERINEEISHMTDLLDEVLFLSKAHAGRLEAKLETVNISALVGAMVETWRGNVSDEHRLEYQTGDQPVEVTADPQLMRVVLTNLLSNAVKYSPNGGLVRCAVQTDNGSAVVTIADQGIGIPEADQAHLFEDFHRAANVGTIEGTGLGMSITKQMVLLHGGTIEVSSQVNQGTTVTIHLPLKKPEI